MRVLLLFPPLTDPTLPPLGIAMVHAVVATDARHDVVSVDLNVELFDALLEEEPMWGAYGVWREKHAAVAGHRALTNRSLPPLVNAAKSDLRCHSPFFTPARYRQATNVVRLAMRLYSEAMESFVISDELNGFTPREPAPTTAREFAREHEEFASLPYNPVRDFLDKRLTSLLGDMKPDVIGIAQVYDAQALLARYVARRTREIRPTAKVVLGGTSLSEHVARLRSRDRETVSAVFGGADYLVVGEGEPAMPALLDVIAGRKSVADVPNIAYIPDHADDLTLTAREYVIDLDALPPPRFEPKTLALYLSPVPVLPIAPTRGCYWDRCVFCAYGLREEHRATAPYREMTPNGVVRHLAVVLEQTCARHVIFAIDVMSGPCAEAYACAIRASGLDVLWQAEMRPEPALLRPGRLGLLAAGGLRHLSLGMESGCQDVLDAMKKGTQVKHFASILREMDANGIAVDLMLFQGFPTETPQQLLTSLRFLIENERYIHRPVRLGRFYLIAGCGVAKAPDRFGVRVSPQERDALLAPDVFEWSLADDEGEGGAHDAATMASQERDLQRDVEAAMRRLTGNSHVGARPWVGSTGSAHTFLYFADKGTESVREYNDFIQRTRVMISELLPWFAARPPAGSASGIAGS